MIWRGVPSVAEARACPGARRLRDLAEARAAGLSPAETRAALAAWAAYDARAQARADAARLVDVRDARRRVMLDAAGELLDELRTFVADREALLQQRVAA